MDVKLFDKHKYYNEIFYIKFFIRYIKTHDNAEKANVESSNSNIIYLF